MLGGWAEQVVGAAGQSDAAPRTTSTTPRPSRCWATTRRCISRWPAAARCGTGETVLVLGSAGGVGTAAVQIAKALGAKVIAMVHRPEATRVRRVAGRRRGAAADRRLAAGGEGAHRRPRRRPRGRPDRRRGVRRRDPGAGHRGPVAGDRLCGRRHPDGQGQPAAAAQRQRHRRRATASTSTASPARSRCSSSVSPNWSRPGCGRRRRCRFPLSKGAAALQSLADGGVLGKVVLEP